MDKETTAIFRLQDAAQMSQRLYQKPLVLTYSGGKDSDVLIHLTDAAGIDYEVQHSLTTVDAPQTVYHIRDVFHNLENEGIPCSIDIHRRPRKGGVTTMWNLIERDGPSDRRQRGCCKFLKETSGKHRFLIMGVRWSQSPQRNQRQTYEFIHVPKEERLGFTNMDNDEDRQTFESCPIKGERTVNPIIDWTDEDIWDYIEAEGIETNPLYEEYGFQRVGCVGCPMTRRAERYARFERWPKYKENYMRAFDKMLEARKAKGRETRGWNNADDVFHWWMEDPVPDETKPEQ